MDKLNLLFAEITQLISYIETNYPELYKFLDEEPITIPNENNPRLDEQLFQKYLENLRIMLNHYIEEHRTAKTKI